MGIGPCHQEIARDEVSESYGGISVIVKRQASRFDVKRSLDWVIAGLSLILLSPVLAAVAIGIRIALGHPILFRQQRPGLNGEAFTLFKFRTMTDARSTDGKLASDDVRLTAFGKFLRTASLDELPELYNVLKGEMSLVGPRPLLMRYMTRYTQTQARRHEVRPGITGWAQINGRNALTWEEKFNLDIWYVDNRTLWLDIKIIAMTVWKIIKREGVNEPGQVTMTEFWGLQRDSGELTPNAPNKS